MANGKNAGRLWPQHKEDREVVEWSPVEGREDVGVVALRWKIDESILSSLGLHSREWAEDYAEKWEHEFVVGSEVKDRWK
jgi:hypothetical protein